MTAPGGARSTGDLDAALEPGGRAGPDAPARAASEIAYCRAILPRVSRTFAISIRLLSGSMGDAVREGSAEPPWPPADPREVAKAAAALVLRGAAPEKS